MRASLEGITVFLTGAKSGIGFVAARAQACDPAARQRLRHRSLALVAPFRRR